ncbi:hypothetical protein PITC_022570 [Penicillium italicum]|uniref:Uncharacterized protein n=1 Tax=Penicillium italicum TaxID=40296 RepID=A0A0A2K991_PENIT|nr:hypothetical protein PITC_022570 [Penicillium italicum]
MPRTRRALYRISKDLSFIILTVNAYELILLK